MALNNLVRQLSRGIHNIGKFFYPLAIDTIDAAESNRERKECRTGALILASVLLIGTPIAYFLGNRIHNNLYNQVAIKADANRDGITDEKEWSEVYEELDIRRIPQHPYQLDNSSLRKYLEKP